MPSVNLGAPVCITMLPHDGTFLSATWLMKRVADEDCDGEIVSLHTVN